LRFPHADIRGVSTRRLPEFLAGIASNRATYRRIVILGVGLAADPPALLTALQTLKDQTASSEKRLADHTLVALTVMLASGGRKE
jgi:hypothetical protein